MPRIRHTAVLVAVLSAFLALAGIAHATGGNYVFDGGTPYQQKQVWSALEASSFNWSLVTQQITIKIAPIGRDYSVPGEIFLDSDLLNSGQYSWGVVQNEYANEVDFFLLSEQAHATFNSALGGTAWCYGDQPGLNMTQYGCERFASTLAWAYWQSPGNCINPSDTGGISGGMAPAAFRALLTSTLGVETETKPTPAQTVRFTTLRLAAANPAPAAKSQISPAATTQTKTPAGPRESQSAKKTAKKAAKPLFSAPLKVSIERVTPTQPIGDSAGLVR